ncbi:MAG: FkbM family methyltransferase [Candidatus Bathyarchaeia archaeon]
MGLLEPYQRRLIHAKKGGIVIDIGANIGFYTLKFAREVGKDGLVVSLEPNPYAFELLNYNIRLNEIERRVRPIKLAAFDKSGLELSFYLEDKGQTPRHDGSVSTILKKGKLLFSAITTTVDELVGDSLHRIDIIKIDTEGAEPEILKGCIKTIERHRPMLIVEVHNFRVKDTIAAIRSMISNYSYDAVMVPRHRYESIGLDNEVTFTVIAYPRRPRN